MADVHGWMRLHEIELRELAVRVDAHEDTVHFLAVLVLAGESDDEIYEGLRAMSCSLDGEQNPLAGAPELLGAVRHLVTTL
jgi:hypothetical protein